MAKFMVAGLNEDAEPFTVYVVIEDTDGAQRWQVLDHHNHLGDAWEHFLEVGAQDYARTGVEPSILDA